MARTKEKEPIGGCKIELGRRASAWGERCWEAVQSRDLEGAILGRAHLWAPMRHAANVALNRRCTAHNFSYQFRCGFDAFRGLEEPTAGQRDQHLPQNLGGARRLARDIGLSPPASTSRFQHVLTFSCKNYLSCEHWVCWMIKPILDVAFPLSGHGMSRQHGTHSADGAEPPSAAAARVRWHAW